MPIEFRCTGCQRTLRTPDDSVGKQAKCPECGAILVVPQPQGVPAASSSVGPETAPGSQGPVENPYRSPSGYTFQGPYGVPISDVQAYAASRLAGPATGLIVIGSIALALQVLGLLAILAGLSLGPEGMKGRGANEMVELLSTGIPGAVAQLVGCALSLLVVLGAIRMKRLESHGFATASAVIAMIPCISPCCVLGFPFGLWALIVLQDGHVRTAFRG
jgi:DNA-directed RNA polymerase subunit RPC12/RpoP